MNDNSHSGTEKHEEENEMLTLSCKGLKLLFIFFLSEIDCELQHCRALFGCSNLLYILYEIELTIVIALFCLKPGRD